MKPTDFLGEKVRFKKKDGYFYTKKETLFCSMRGWAKIYALFHNEDDPTSGFKAREFHKNLGQWIADAINEKLERERNG